MRPIELKIKGINSYREEQVINFSQLTSQGFFGIFGPTGSGKSTILDAITLALYTSWKRRLQYGENFSSFNKKLVLQIAKDTNTLNNDIVQMVLKNHEI